MKTSQRTVTVYLDMMPQDHEDSCAYCIPIIVGGDAQRYIPDVTTGCLRNKVEITVTVPIKNEMVKLPGETAEVVEIEKEAGK